jgi:hypothetical protein
MKRRIARNWLVTVFAATLFMSMATTARAEGPVCSLALTAGKWGFTTSGIVVGIGPRASLGVFTLDGAGNFLDGKVTASLNGSVTDETASGTYTVNPDCTAKFVLDIFNLSGDKILTATLDVVFDSNVQELRAMFRSIALPDGTHLATVITADGRKLFLGQQ